MTWRQRSGKLDQCDADLRTARFSLLAFGLFLDRVKWLGISMLDVRPPLFFCGQQVPTFPLRFRQKRKPIEAVLFGSHLL